MSSTDKTDKTARPSRVDRGDIENKFRELQTELTSAAESAKSRVLVVGAAAAVGVLLVAYLLGRRSGKKRSTIVEIRRL